MKKLKFLFLVPALFSMVACGLGKEVNADKAKEIAKGMKDVKQPDNFEAKLNMTSYDAEDKTTTSANYDLKKNGDGELYAALKTETKGDGESFAMDLEVYYVKNEKYDEVVYMKDNNADEKDKINVVVKKGNELEFAAAFGEIQSEVASLSVYMTFADALEEAIESAELEAKANENVEVKYYSNGNQNLTIKETMKESDDEIGMSGESTITFDKGLLQSTETKMSNKAGDKMELKLTMKYPNSVKISLPSGWESYIEQE